MDREFNLGRKLQNTIANSYSFWAITVGFKYFTPKDGETILQATDLVNLFDADIPIYLIIRRLNTLKSGKYTEKIKVYFLSDEQIKLIEDYC